MTTADTLTMAEAAAQAGLSYERFRKVWRELCEQEGFPAPLRARVWWAQAVTDWKAARSGAGKPSCSHSSRRTLRNRS